MGTQPGTRWCTVRRAAQQPYLWALASNFSFWVLCFWASNSPREGLTAAPKVRPRLPECWYFCTAKAFGEGAEQPHKLDPHARQADSTTPEPTVQ